VDVSYEVKVPTEKKTPFVKMRQDKQLKSRVVEVKETEKYKLVPKFDGIEKVEVKTVAEGCNFGTVEIGANPVLPNPTVKADHEHKYNTASVSVVAGANTGHKDHKDFFKTGFNVLKGNGANTTACGCDAPGPCDDIVREFKPKPAAATTAARQAYGAEMYAEPAQSYYDQQAYGGYGQQAYGGYDQQTYGGYGQQDSGYAPYVGGHGAAYGGKMANTGGRVGMRAAPKPDTKMQMSNLPKGYSAANAEFLSTTERKRREDAFAQGGLSSHRNSAANRYVQSWRLNA